MHILCLLCSLHCVQVIPQNLNKTVKPGTDFFSSIFNMAAFVARNGKLMNKEEKKSPHKTKSSWFCSTVSIYMYMYML